jgi:hypothetical protein
MKAFPSNEPIYGDNIVGIKENKGMDLRDYFAAKALQGILACNYSVDEDPVILAYQYADEMMKARERK